MSNIPAVLHPRWVVCCDDQNRVLENHAVVLQDDLIADIVEWPDAQAQYPNADVIELSQQVLLPGLVNSHTHLAMNLLRGYADDLPLMTWLRDHIWPAESALVDFEFVEDGTRLAIAELLKSGVTCFNDMYFFPDAVAKAAIDTGIRASVSIIVIDFPTAWAQNPDEYLRKGMDLYEQIQDKPNITAMLAPHAPYTAGTETLKKVLRLQEQHGLGIHMHVHETADEVKQFIQDHRNRPITQLDQLGLLNEQLCAVHVTQTNDEEINLLAKSGCHVLHCPESNLKLASGFAPIVKMTEAGINIAMGTDGAASNNDLDLLGETRTAGFIAKCVSGDAAALPAAQLLRMATINGAKAIGLGDVTGSIEKGKQADLISIDFGSVNMQPVYNVVSHLIYCASRNDVRNTWVAGERLLSDGELTTLDTEALINNATEWAAKINRLN